MEGLYFFGENLRWNLGWNNPNQAGVFVGMWLPWFWALGTWARGGNDGPRPVIHRLQLDAAAMLVLAGEFALWFLLCKTYSRGALVATGVAGMLFFLWCWRERKFGGFGWLMARLAGIGILLWTTGFFSRIDPRFVSQDASAGNRLVLWKGGIQMIAQSPWRGWGGGQSGNGFVHWFQPLDATERYAGMVNSYLHVGVEYGLPVLVGVMTGAMGVCLLAWGKPGARRSGNGLARDAAAARRIRCLMMGAGCSWAVFLVANVFSTLWIFRNLWWLPGANVILILACGWVAGFRVCSTAARAFGVAAMLAMAVATGIYLAGSWLAGDTRIAYRPGKGVVVSGEGRNGGQVLLFPDSSVLGDDWGKEIRRLASARNFRGMEILTPAAGSPNSRGVSDFDPEVIIACGGRFEAGFAALLKFPEARLVLVHPIGKHFVPEDVKGRVSVILPMLDTQNSGLGWRKISKKMGWPVLTSPGVGQDIRPVWPEMMEY